MERRRGHRKCLFFIGIFIPLVVYIILHYITVLLDAFYGISFFFIFIHRSIFGSVSRLPRPLVSGPMLNSTPSEAFVVFSDNKPGYLDLLSNLLDSVHYFSTRPVIAYGIDVDLDLDIKKYPRLIKRRLSRSDCGPSIYFCKIYAMVDSQVNYGVQLEADSVVNWNVDVLFDMLHRWPYPYPLAPRHPDDPLNYLRFLDSFYLTLENRTTPYIHAQFSWNYRAYPFLEHALDLMRDYNFRGANYDETGINILLWQAKANHTLCRIDPFLTYLPEYVDKANKCEKQCNKVYILLHGGKELNEMRDIFERLKKAAGSPFVQTGKSSLHYLNETQYTCCGPDTRPSSIHPLICESKRKSAKVNL